MVVKITQEQADYLKTFGRQESKAIYYISRWGWDYFLEDGLGKTYEDTEEKPFNLDEKEKMINALINGYEVDEPKYKFYNFSNITSVRRLYYTGKNRQFTENYFEGKEIKKGSDEYLALESLGFRKEEVR